MKKTVGSLLLKFPTTNDNAEHIKRAECSTKSLKTLNFFQ